MDAEYKKAVAAAAPVPSNVADVAPSPLPVKGAVEAAMGGVFVNQVISKSCPHRSEREEHFTGISVDVRNKRNLQESLASYVQVRPVGSRRTSSDFVGIRRISLDRARGPQRGPLASLPLRCTAIGCQRPRVRPAHRAARGARFPLRFEKLSLRRRTYSSRGPSS